MSQGYVGAMMLIDRSWLDGKATKILIAALNAGGVDFRFVGGAVRDGLLGRPVSDIDIATPATPEAVVRVIEAGGLKAIPTGIAHGTVTALVGRKPFEITTLRRDVETDGRHAVVAFTDDWREDAARRDFTMNALYADRDGCITDFFGGQADAQAGRVRFIGDPASRIAEDALRILRFFRFHAWYGQGAPDPEGLAACGAHAGMIDRLSGERVRVEIFKTLAAPNPAPVWQAMIAAGIMAHAIPAATRVDRLSKMIDLEDALGLTASPLRRLVALIGVRVLDVMALKSGLKLSNRDVDYLSSFAGFADRLKLVEQGAFGQAIYGVQPQWMRDAALLDHVEAGRAGAGNLAALGRFIEDWVQPVFPLTGADLMAEGIQPGPEMGSLLAQAENRWVKADFAPDRAACLASLRVR